MVGPTVQDDLLSILIRFRQHRFVISGDIEKMYRAIEINSNQRSLQQILFRSDTSQPIQIYTLNSVTYGTASAPYLATKCLSTLASNASNITVKNSILRDFYVDDYLSGGATIEDVIKQSQEVISILSSAKFNLRKFQSNNLEILQAVTNNNVDHNNMLHLSESKINNEPSRTLGLHWICDSDVLAFTINIENKEKVTKRNILSAISQIFDPLGLVTPAIVEAKLLIQCLWKARLNWDTDVPNNIKSLWMQFYSEICNLNQIKIPRWFLSVNYKKVELHIFSDASEKAYGACAYARSIGQDGSIHVQLITSKNRVAPIKPSTIPRLELSGALLGARLCTKILNSITIPVDCRYWCDSTIVLCWLAMPAHRLKPFVRNRVNEINESTAGCPWSYVPSLQNPADLVSRGVKADLISSSALWWSGPSFLQKDESLWPKMPISNEKRDLPEVVCHHISQIAEQDSTENCISKSIHKHSNLTRSVHILAYVSRFISNCKLKNTQDRVIGNLTQEEIQSSLNIIIKQSQSEMFPEEQALLMAGKVLPFKNRLLSLSPFLDANNIIRIGGRLTNSPYSYDQKHPILLCSKHYFTKLIFRTQHTKLLHVGPLSLLASIRQTYWPLGGRNLARSTASKCVTCFRNKRKSVQPMMGQLPESRTELEYPFLNCSVDYAGPVLIADKKGRGCKLIKSYICIFVCLAVKAVHLELVTDLTKEAYRAALLRFFSRRGKCRSITSDNATTFVGACNELHKLVTESSIGTELADEENQVAFRQQ
ncbi:uncharacterized protein LOC125489283 [Plutella xylostella]|uniref:uncharacterized protein LOC125489283 n=1 Tax=Plutella xylostella TaxID=51655 RepID=UPI002032FDAF|nr:uncharacterized protein LOC125489283 [Plutella xylostella]